MIDRDVLGLLGQRVRHFRERHGWSQEELARRCDRHFTYVGRVERGRQNITVEVLHDLAVALGVEITDLLVEEGHPLLAEWKVTPMDIIHAVSHGFRAQVDVKGKLAEWMLFKESQRLRGADAIQEIEWLDADDKPDFIVRVGRRVVVVEQGFHLAQEFFWYNPAKLPAPAEWVNVRKIRVKDSVECVWWFSKDPFPKANNQEVL